MAATLEKPMDVNTFLASLRRHRLLAMAAALVVLQALFFCWWIWGETMARGRVFRVPLAVYDPRDLLRGQYMNLSYAFEEAGSYPDEGRKTRYERGDAVHAVLRRDPGTDVFEPFAYHESREEVMELATELLREENGWERTFREWERSGELVLLRGKAKSRARFDFGGSRLFVPEGTREPPAAGVIAILVVTPSGRIRVDGLEIDGELWKPEGVK